ncbi:MAG: hypothetical protein ICV68_08100 [Pyrinomonadaceae bacterium]|nr:hypothetical protein [Pyrinomonadaceae bacterium]
MASLNCSNCGFVNLATDANCKRCGAPLAQGAEPRWAAPASNVAPQYGAGGPGSSLPPPDAYYPASQTSHHAPGDAYVFPPPPSVGLQGGVWRNDSTLVMSKEAALPDRCVKCNRPANGLRLKRKLYWHNPVYYIFIFGGVLLYFIIAMFVRWQATVDVPLCETHLARRRYLLIAGWLFFLLGIVGFIIAIASNELIFAPVGMIAIFVGFVLLIASARTVLPVKMDDRFVWLKGINKDYLNQLPQWVDLT